MTSQPAIDAVITWVDGADPTHLAKRRAAQARATGRLHENAINPHRWGDSDELDYCLRALANHAPWLRRVWIVTDDQRPDLSALPDGFRARVAVVDHRAVFAGAEHHLPTFNSLAIETQLWRIPGLAEHFVYFNDDVFLTAPLAPSDVFVSGVPVLRGRWVDLSALAADAASRDDPALFHSHVQINAARLAGFSAARMWASAHVVHPMRRSVMARLARRHKAVWQANLGHRFRDIAQFLPVGLHNHACLRAGAFRLHPVADHLHLHSTAAHDTPPDELRARLQRATLPQSKFLCVNDLRRLEQALPDTRAWIERAIAAA